MMLSRRCTRFISENLSVQTRASASIRIPSWRAFSASPAALKYSKFGPRNEGITVKIAQRDEGGSLSPPEPVEEILKSINRRTHFVELIQKNPPIVKVFEKKAFQAAAKATRDRRMIAQGKKSPKTDRKELQMTWSVNEKDLTHKIIKAREYLERDDLVDIAFAPKSKKMPPPLNAMKGKMQGIVDALGDIAVERQERTLMRFVGIVYLRLDKTKLKDKDNS